MKILRFKSINTQLTFWFLTLTLIPLFAVLVVTYYQQSSTIKTQTFDKLTAIRDLKVLQLKAWIIERAGDLESVSDVVELTELEFIINKTSLNKNEMELIDNIRHIINHYLDNFNSYADIFIINPVNGKIIISTKPDEEGLDKSTDPYFTMPMHTGKLSIKDIYYSESISGNSMTFSVPIFSNDMEDKKIVGILVARIDLQNSLYNLLLERVGLGETGETLIVNEDVIALNELRWRKDAPLKLHILAEPAVKAANGGTGITKTTDYRGEPIMAAYTFIPETKWGFICKQDIYELNKPIRLMVWNFVFIFFITSIIITIVAVVISKTFTKPIIKMNLVANKFGAGDYSARNINIPDDELGSLAEEFNNMANITEARLLTQKGVSDITEKMITPTNLDDFGSELLKQLLDSTGATMSVFYILNEATSEFEYLTSIGANVDLLVPFKADIAEGEIGNALSTKNIYYLRDIPDNTIFTYNTSVGSIIPKEIITIPILIDYTVVAVISLANIRKFSNDVIDILKQSYSAINTSYSNLLAGERTRIFADQLASSNQKLEAQTEELQDLAEELQQQTEELQEQTSELHTTSEELQKQNISLENQKQQVESANKLKSEFLSNMSHELRTPLNSIMALSRVLILQAENKLNDEEKHYLEIVERNGKHLLSLINDILDLSKIEAGKMKIIKSTISVESLIQMVTESMYSLAAEKDIYFKIKTQPNLPKIETDESKLHQALINIIGNAVKFSKKGTISIILEQSFENIIIKVVDTGIGISKEMLPHIFDEFRQADGTSSRKYEGTGLGLAISNKIISILGGTITAQSELNKGSAFTITLPVVWHKQTLLNKNVIENIVFDKKTNDAVEKIIIANKEISDTTILIIEDNKETILQLHAVLSKEGYNVAVAQNGKEALEYIKHAIPDGIILDLMMPYMDGFEVMNKLREIKTTRNTPILVLTAKDLSNKELSQLKANNIHQLIQKGDIDINGLLTKVMLMVGNKKTTHKVVKETKQPIKSNKIPDILVIEDNADNMVTFKAILETKYNIIEASSGEQGLNLARKQIPDIILLDMSLPNLSGEELASILKGDITTSSIPIIAVTAQVMKGDRERFINAGCDSFMPKPIDTEGLLNEIDKLLT